MKYVIAFILAASMASNGFSQRYYTKNGQIDFDATSPASPERIDAVNRSATCVMDTKTGALQFAVLMKGFQFERALMQEHFNENYIESDRFPKAEFKGTIVNNETVNYEKEDSYSVKVKGNLTLHGETKEIETEGKLVVSNGKILATSDFKVLLADYHISIPGIVANKVSKSASIKIACSLEPLKN